MTGKKREEIVPHVRWTVTTSVIHLRCLNCGKSFTCDLEAVTTINEPERILYEFTAKHKDCKYEPR